MSKVVEASIIGLLEEILKRPGMTQDRVARESQIPTEAGGQAIRNEIQRKHRIYVKLVDYVLKETVFAGDPVERAMAHLQHTGLKPDELAHVRAGIEMLRPKMLEVEINHDAVPGRTVMAVKPAASAVAQPALPSTQYQTRPQTSSEVEALTREEVEAFAAWAGQNTLRAPVEHPLTIALQKISTMLICGIVPAELPLDAGKVGETLETPSKAAPTSGIAPQPHQPAPSSQRTSASSPSSPPRVRSGKKK